MPVTATSNSSSPGAVNLLSKATGPATNYAVSVTVADTQTYDYVIE